MKDSDRISLKKAITATLTAWLIFIGVDFLFHASILSSMWDDNIPAIKTLENLALLIPSGYLSFLLLTALIAYVFFRIYRTKPKLKEVVKFGLIFGLLFSLSNLSGLFSYVAIPFKKLLVFNLVYFIEILAVTLNLYFVYFAAKMKRSVWLSVLIFLGLLILGIVIQNII